jgi:hypothetical protein
MEFNLKKNRIFPQKPEWKIILDLLVYQDSSFLFRISRKMMIHLFRMKTPEIHLLIEELNPSIQGEFEDQNIGLNWPKPKGNFYMPKDIAAKVFEIADIYIPDDEILLLLTKWLHREKLRTL